jgi:replicative DNA helicase Mcm
MVKPPQNKTSNVNIEKENIKKIGGMISVLKSKSGKEYHKVLLKIVMEIGFRMGETSSWLVQNLKEESNFFITDFMVVEKQIMKDGSTKGKLETDIAIDDYDYEELSIGTIRETHSNKPIIFDCSIDSITQVYIEVVCHVYKCESCGAVSNQAKKKAPECPNCEKKMKYDSTVEHDVQELVATEIQDEVGSRQAQRMRIKLIGDRVPKEIREDLVGGNRVRICGIVTSEKLNVKKELEIREFVIKALKIETLEDNLDDEITAEDMEEIKKIASDNPFKKLTDNFAPSISGMEDIKKATVLQMAGGVKEQKLMGANTRGMIHLLVCGSPGTGKSEILENHKLRVPKSIFVSGDNTTAVGLTAGVEKEELTGRWALKAGSMVKAHGGFIELDELEKMHEDHIKSLHTPMEKGQVIINKAGIKATMGAETSIIACSNPRKGDFRTGIPKIEQMGLPPALINRFDLIFAIESAHTDEEITSINKMIYFGKEDEAELISIELYRKYMIHCRTYKPKFSPEMFDTLNDFFLDMVAKMKGNVEMKAFPMNARFFTGMMRLAQASAKIRLSNEVNEGDIEIAKSIILASFDSLGINKDNIDELGFINTGKTVEEKKGDDRLDEWKAKVEVESTEVHKLLMATGKKNLTYTEVKFMLSDKGIDEKRLGQIIKRLEHNGKIQKIMENIEVLDL